MNPMQAPEKTTCQQCGSVLPEDRPGSLCLRCVLEVAVDFDQPRRDTKDATLDDTSSLTREVDDVVEGARIGPYKILQKIGEGGFGMVYMAAQSGAVHRRVALKIIKAGMDTRQVIARFEAERQALAMMDHPNIARVFDAGETETGRPYFVMELVKGIPLSQFCREENLDTTARLHLFIQVCKAVQHAHLKGVIHRDLKPSNVLVTLHDGEAVPKVIDFGIAKAIDQELTDKTLFTRYEQMIGTPAYMSPEQAALSGLDVDTRSDVYALGVLLYEILTGTTPFDAKTLREAAFDEMRRIIREEEPPRPSTRLTQLRTEQQAGERLAPISVPASEVARDLDWVVMKALEKDRSRRYDTAGGLARDVERYLANEPVEAGAPTLRYKMGKFVRRNRIPAAAAVAVAMAIVTGLVLAFWGMFRATAAEKVAKGEAAAATVAREEASAEAAAAREARDVEAAMNAFLMEDLLGQASPHESMEPDLEVRTVLERASRRLGDRFAGRPRLEAEMRLKLGEVYEALSLREDAHGHFERAAELLEGELGSESPDFLKARHGEVRTLPAEIDRIKALKELLPIHERVLGPDHLETIAVQYWLARNYGVLVERGLQSASVAREGLELSKQVAEARTRILGEEDPSTIDSMGIHAYLLFLAGESEKAEAKLLYLLSVLKEDTFRYSTHKAGCLNLLGLCRARQDDRAGAVRYSREGLQVSQRTLGPLHSQTTTLILNLLWDLKPEEVLPFAEETLPAYLSSTEGAERRGQFLFRSFEYLAAGGFFAEAASYHLKAAALFSSSSVESCPLRPGA